MREHDNRPVGGGWLLGVALVVVAAAGCSSSGHATSADAKPSRPASPTTQAPTTAPPSPTVDPTTAPPTTRPPTTKPPTPKKTHKPLPPACRYLTEDQVTSVAESLFTSAGSVFVDTKASTQNGRPSCQYSLLNDDPTSPMNGMPLSIWEFTVYPGATTFGASKYKVRSVSFAGGSKWDGSTLQVRYGGGIVYVTVGVLGDDAKLLKGAERLYDDAKPKL